MIFRGILWIVLLVAVMLAGCSVTVIRPPSAAAFMEKSEDKFVKDISVALHLNDCYWKDGGCQKIEADKSLKKEKNEEWSYKDNEYPFDYILEFQKSRGSFKYGFGINMLTPFVQAGYVSDYFGVMGWSNLCLWQFEKIEYAYFQWGGGISLIEQLPLDDNFWIGLTQHLSRNGDAGLASDGSGIAYNHSAPKFYDEIGFGGYISFIPYEQNKVIFEFRYGRDLTYKRIDQNGKANSRNRYSYSIAIQGW